MSSDTYNEAMVQNQCNSDCGAIADNLIFQIKQEMSLTEADKAIDKTLKYLGQPISGKPIKVIPIGTEKGKIVCVRVGSPEYQKWANQQSEAAFAESMQDPIVADAYAELQKGGPKADKIRNDIYKNRI